METKTFSLKSDIHVWAAVLSTIASIFTIYDFLHKHNSVLTMDTALKTYSKEAAQTKDAEETVTYNIKQADPNKMFDETYIEFKPSF